jgi:predicted PurR-regulated permease PerM
MSIFRRVHHEHRESAAAPRQGQSEAAKGLDEAHVAPSDAPSPFVVPEWLRDFGRSSWFLIGLVIVLLALCALVAALRALLLPMIFAALLGATFMPLADKLERRGVKRWIAALLVMVLIVLISIAVTLIVVVGVFNQFPTVKENLNAAADAASQWLSSHDVSVSRDQITSTVQKAGPAVIQGVVGTLVKGVQDVAGLIFGIFIGLNILVWFLMQGAGLGLWASKHMSPIPQPVAYRILANAARFLRGYIWGSTLIGLFNGGMMFVGALALGVPLAATIGIVGWFTNYVPMFGAIIGGAFAVLVALGAGGLPEALAMLAIVIFANGPLQTVVSQFALGAALKLHPLAVLFATTAGAILFGAVGGILAAPFLKIVIDSFARLKAAGLFGAPAARDGGAPGRAASSDEGPPDGGAEGGAGPPGAAVPGTAAD